jgi:hypothetical protein
LVQQWTDKNKPKNEPWFKCKLKEKLEHPCNNLKHIIEVRRVGVGGLMLNEIEYDDKKTTRG